MKFLLLCSFAFQLIALDIIPKPIIFDEKRIALTKAYILQRYNKSVETITITPKMIVIHWTADDSLHKSFQRFQAPTLSRDRNDIAKASKLNVSAHFLIDQNGTIYQLMDETHMARHVIGLNYASIGIENVGGENNNCNLTDQQLISNIALINHLKQKYPIEYLIGHYEYTHFTQHPLWLEKERKYRTTKYDPGEAFMKKIRNIITDLKGAP